MSRTDKERLPRRLIVECLAFALMIFLIVVFARALL